MRFRRAYYDLFSHVYDRVIALHSGDASARLRDLLIERTGIKARGRLLDLCTGTGAVAVRAQTPVEPGGLVVGVDFSAGMIRRARGKARKTGVADVTFVVGDAARLPFANGSFDAVSCSHAMCELSPEVRDRAIQEVSGVLRPGGRFVMMEHCEPSRPLVRFLNRVRLSVLGSSENRDFARYEVPFLRRYFADVRRELSPTDRSKLIIGNKHEGDETPG